MNVNKAIICGNLTRDPEERTLPSGQAVSSFGIATNRAWTNQEGQKQEQVEFHNIVAFGKLAEICNQYLAKGRLVYIDGRLQTRTWEGQDGVKKNRTEIVAETMQMGPRPAGTDAVGAGHVLPKKEEEKPRKKPDNKNEVRVENIPF
ncbi:MAG: single-stranded DNA-binding protein [bacterium]